MGSELVDWVSQYGTKLGKFSGRCRRCASRWFRDIRRWRLREVWRGSGLASVGSSDVAKLMCHGANDSSRWLYAGLRPCRYLYKSFPTRDRAVRAVGVGDVNNRFFEPLGFHTIINM